MRERRGCNLSMNRIQLVHARKQVNHRRSKSPYIGLSDWNTGSEGRRRMEGELWMTTTVRKSDAMTRNTSLLPYRPCVNAMRPARAQRREESDEAMVRFRVYEKANWDAPLKRDLTTLKIPPSILHQHSSARRVHCFNPTATRS